MPSGSYDLVDVDLHVDRVDVYIVDILFVVLFMSLRRHFLSDKTNS